MSKPYVISYYTTQPLRWPSHQRPCLPIGRNLKRFSIDSPNGNFLWLNHRHDGAWVDSRQGPRSGSSSDALPSPSHGWSTEVHKNIPRLELEKRSIALSTWLNHESSRLIAPQFTKCQRTVFLVRSARWRCNVAVGPHPWSWCFSTRWSLIFSNELIFQFIIFDTKRKECVTGKCRSVRLKYLVNLPIFRCEKSSVKNTFSWKKPLVGKMFARARTPPRANRNTEPTLSFVRPNMNPSPKKQANW